MPWCRLFGGTLLVKSRSQETEPAQRRFRGCVWWNAGGASGDGAAAWSRVQGLGADGAGSGRRRRRGPAAGKLTFLLAATRGPSGGVAAGLMVSGGLGVALPSASC